MIDSHTHLNDPLYINICDEYIKEAKENNVTKFLCVGYDLESSLAAVNIANKYEDVYAAIGFHPSEINKIKEGDILKLEQLIKDNKKVVAIGEIGLDFYWEKDEKQKEKQIFWFKEFIKLANKFNLPVVIHSRDAIDLTYNILNENRVNKSGVIHCYSANKYYVPKYVELGYYFGIGGVLTFKNSQTLKESVKLMPIDRILLESDSPYLTPVPFRGKPNHSKYIPYTLNEMSNLLNINKEIIDEQTSKNFVKLFLNKEQL